MAVCECGCGGEVHSGHYKRHISSMLMHFGELETSFSPIASSTAISYSSVVDCGESYGQMYTVFLDLCVLS